MAEFARRPYGPVGIGQSRTSQQNDVHSSLANELVRVVRRAEVPTRGHRHPNLALDARRAFDHEADVVEWRVLDVVRVQPQADVCQIEAMLLHGAYSGHSIVELETLRVMVVATQTHG